MGISVIGGTPVGTMVDEDGRKLIPVKESANLLANNPVDWSLTVSSIPNINVDDPSRSFISDDGSLYIVVSKKIVKISKQGVMEWEYTNITGQVCGDPEGNCYFSNGLEASSNHTLVKLNPNGTIQKEINVFSSLRYVYNVAWDNVLKRLIVLHTKASSGSAVQLSVYTKDLVLERTYEAANLSYVSSAPMLAEGGIVYLLRKGTSNAKARVYIMSNMNKLSVSTFEYGFIEGSYEVGTTVFGFSRDSVILAGGYNTTQASMGEIVKIQKGSSSILEEKSSSFDRSFNGGIVKNNGHIILGSRRLNGDPVLGSVPVTDPSVAAAFTKATWKSSQVLNNEMIPSWYYIMLAYDEKDPAFYYYDKSVTKLYRIRELSAISGYKTV